MKIFFSNKTLRNLILLQLSAVLIQPIMLLWKFSQIPDQIPFYYSRPRGIDQLAPNIILFILPIINFTLICIHTLFANKFYKQQLLASYFIISSSLITTILLLISFLRVIFLIS
jgi:hypothetical protein